MDNQIEKPKKPLNWMILYIALFVIGQQLAGIGGAIGGVFIAFGLNRVIRNPNYPKNKKILYSILYTIGGVAMALVIAFGLTLVLRYYFPTIGQKSNIESTYQVPSNFSTYKNENMEISSLAYPTGWVITEGKKDEYTVNFQSPDRIANATVNLLALDEGQTLDYKTYTTELTEQAKAEPSITFEKTGEEIKSINGKDWLIFDSIVGVKSQNTFYYNRTAILVTGKYGNRQYFSLIIESDKDNFSEDLKISDKMIESFRFYK